MADARTIFVTGSSSGIGREIAFRFAREGWAVVLSYRLGRSRGLRAEARCRALGAPATSLLALDVTDPASVAAAARAIRRRGGTDVLVNNAGTGVWVPFLEHRAADDVRMIRTNLEGLIEMTRACLPLVRDAVVNVASAAGEEAYAEMAVYGGTKFGVRGFTQALAKERRKPKVFCVNPDQTATRLTGYVGRPPEQVAETVFRAVTGRVRVRPGGDVDVWRVMGR